MLTGIARNFTSKALIQSMSKNISDQQNTAIMASLVDVPKIGILPVLIGSQPL
jgi:hypothetical protein